MPKILRRLAERYQRHRWMKWARSMIGKQVIGTGRCCHGCVKGKVYTLVSLVEDVYDFRTNEHRNPGVEVGCWWLCPNGLEGGMPYPRNL